MSKIYFSKDSRINTNELQAMTALVQSLESQDCTVCALSFVFNISYENAHSLCRAYGRQNGQGFHIQSALLNHLKNYLTLLPNLIGESWKNVKFDSEKTYLILVKGHIYGIKNGQTSDNLKSRPRQVHSRLGSQSSNFR